jgi:hypothetical protein
MPSLKPRIMRMIGEAAGWSQISQGCGCPSAAAGPLKAATALAAETAIRMGRVIAFVTFPLLQTPPVARNGR